MSNKTDLINGTANGGFYPDDIVNAPALLQELVLSERPLAMYLRDRFTKAELLPVPPWAASDAGKFKAKIAEELTRIAGGDPLYTEERFAHTKLSAYTRKLLRQNPVGPKLVSLNKVLLLDALPKHLRRKPGRGKNVIQKAPKVRRLGNGKYAVFVDLVEPRELEGKMRSGRQKFERQTEEDANSLCAVIYANLFDQELARQLNKHEIGIAKKFFWELLEPEHPEWIEHLDLVVEHCENTGFQVDNDKDIPIILEAAKTFWREHVRGLEPESRMNYRNAFGFMLPAFGKLKPFQMTDAMVLRLAHGDNHPLAFWKTSWKKGEAPEEAEKRLWDTPIESRCKRPWKHEMKVRFISCVRSFKNWMHGSLDPITQEKRDWCPPSEMHKPKPPKLVEGKAGDDEESDEVISVMCKKHPALTVPQAQAVLDISHIAFDGSFAAFYAHCLFGGSRVKETRRMGTKGYDPVDGVQAIAMEADKKDQGRESTLYPNLIVIIEALKAAGLYSKKNLRPHGNQRAVIHALAGFSTNAKQILKRAERERKRLAKLGVVLPKHNWGAPFPKNALRRTALSMHYKLFGSEALTKEWAGNGDVFRPFYKRLVNKPAAGEYWVMLPSHIQRAGVKVDLPEGHKLDSAMTTEVTVAASAAGEAMKAAMAKLAEAKAKAEAARPAELKARRAVYNLRARLKRKAKERSARQSQKSASEDQAGPGAHAA